MIKSTKKKYKNRKNRFSNKRLRVSKKSRNHYKRKTSKHRRKSKSKRTRKRKGRGLGYSKPKEQIDSRDLRINMYSIKKALEDAAKFNEPIDKILDDYPTRQNVPSALKGKVFTPEQRKELSELYEQIKS